jgi:hypothetical protein
MDGPKRRVNKYGRGGRKALVHDLFDVTSQPRDLYTSTPDSPAHSLVPTRAVTASTQASDDQDLYNQLNSEMMATWDTEKLRLKSPARKKTTLRQAIPAADFDIESSEEEKPAQMKPLPKIYKRRKITPTGSDVEKHEPRGRSRQPMTTEDPNTHDRKNSPTKMGRKHTQQTKVSGSTKTTVGATGSRGKRQSLSMPQSPKRRTVLKPVQLSRPATPPHHSPADIGSPASDVSGASMMTTRSATKRKREAGDATTSDLSSPSQLELSSLRLTPRRQDASTSRSKERGHGDGDIQMTSPPRVRRRLIDRLEAASPHFGEQKSGLSRRKTKSLDRLSSHSERTNKPTTDGAPSFSPRKQEAESSQSQTDTIKPRKYGKQRSHLQTVGTGSSQGSGSQTLDTLVSQVDAMADSQRSQFDLEMSDDEDDGTHLKSIHELRQAGAVNRYDRDLDSLLEDIASDTKSLRISGLMQLVRKLKEQTFKRHLLDQGKIGKLVGLISADVDIISASILLLAFWTLAHSESATGHVLSQLYEGIMKLPPAIVQETRSLSKIAKARDQNISKALFRDVFDFEIHVLDQSASSGRQTNQLVISRIAIRAVEVMLRRVLSLGEYTAVTPKPWLVTTIACIQTHLDASSKVGGSTVLEHAESIRLLLAWLELSEASSGSLSQSLTNEEAVEFARLLSEILKWAGHQNVSIEHSCLKLAIEMSHRKDAVAKALAKVEFSTVAFAIVEDHFPSLADKAVQGFFQSEDTADADKLSSVILALGSLLDVVDSVEEIRVQMMNYREGRGSQVDQLVKLFRVYVDETDEVSDSKRAMCSRTDRF